MTIFAFDLDSTITMAEMFPRMAEEVGQGAAMRRLTDDVLAGRVPLEESLVRRVALLASIPLPVAHRILASIPLDPDIEHFIRTHKKRCAVVTANLDIWITPVLERLGCRAFSSRAEWRGGRARLVSVVDKRAAARILRREGGTLAAVGDSAADIPMLEEANFGYAHAGVHEPPDALRAVATAVTPDGATLCRYLEALL